MVILKRLRVLTAALGVATATAAVATTLFGDVRGGRNAPPAQAVRPDGAKVVDELAVTKFTNLPALTYQPAAGDTLFAWQVKPALDPAPARPRDLLVVVDTSASQAGLPLRQARQVLTAVAAALGPDDRVSVWAVNTPDTTRALTKDFQVPDSDDLRAAAAALTEVEYGSGATDLKGGLTKALATLQPNRGRHQAVLYLGDGESTYDPMSEADRVAVGTQMDRDDVFFFAVPLGLKLNAHTIHGLAALTGGAVVRMTEDLTQATPRAEFVGKLKAALDGPVFKADKAAFGPEVAEVFPSKLPPLRADKPTLVLGKLAKPAGRVTLNATGTTARKPVTLALGQDLPAPQKDHFFLNLMLDQWRGAAVKEAPAVLQADRALALASTQVKLYRDEFLTQATWAVTMDKLDEAAKLYEAAVKIDPTDIEAGSGLALVRKMKAGVLSKADLEKTLKARAEALRIGNNGDVRKVVQDLGAAAQPPAGAAQPPAAGQPAVPAVPGGAEPPAPADLLREQAQLQRVEEDRTRVLVDQTIREARRRLRTDPDGAYQDLKRQQEEILRNTGIGQAARERLAADLNAVLQEVFLKGAEIKRQAAAEREQIARTRQRLTEFERQRDDENRIKARIDAFRQLMQQARYELAYQEAQLMIQERVSRGQSVPSAAVASYIIGQQATHLREWRELTRIREDRFLLTMMQTEKSHIPYPDEPPVHFPPAAVWRELTGLRRERYQNQPLGVEGSATQRKLQTLLEETPVSLGETDLQTAPLVDVLRELARRYDVTFIVNNTAFENPGTLADARAANLSAARLEGLTLGTFLDVYLRALPIPEGVTYIVRPDFIEITSYNKRLEEKVTRVFPVGDLTIPIPSSVNQQVLQQNLNVQNQTLAIFGAASLYGNSGFLGTGSFGGGNFGGGAPGGFGGPGGAPMGGFGMGGGQFFGMGAGQQGIVGLGGGAGGGVGQFGNLGGQFGLQGGDQYRILEQLIFETVAKGEWANTPPPPTNPNEPAEESYLPANQRNSLGYYPPARALIVRGTSRYHGYGSFKLTRRDGMAAAPRPGNADRLVINPVTPKAAPAATPPKDAVAARPADAPTVIPPDPLGLRAKLDKDPRKMWNQAVDLGVNNPAELFAAAVVLFEFDRYGDAAEVLKANLRKGLNTNDWVHDLLAVTLQMSKGSPAEVERAALSAVDLDPADPKGYLKAARAEADLDHHDRAVALCRRAAEVGPDEPTAYADALAYAGKAKGVTPDTVAWAAGNLLGRDWGVTDSEGVDYHARAKVLIPQFVEKFEKAGAKADALKALGSEPAHRDLVIELLWQGPADLDLAVAEPPGTVCSATARRTAGGGVLAGDQIEQDNGNRTEVYTAGRAFSGTYTVTVKKAFGRADGNKARLKVTKFRGTPKEAHDLIEVDLAADKPVEVKLDGGSRAELAAVTPEAAAVRADPPAGEGLGLKGMGGA
ncbi:MAG: VWA domain-containing protein, partial [Gemmataceae bacterium]|nr:VWA domain-containing protein [Gemmataceae bacterium]